MLPNDRTRISPSRPPCRTSSRVSAGGSRRPARALLSSPTRVPLHALDGVGVGAKRDAVPGAIVAGEIASEANEPDSYLGLVARTRSERQQLLGGPDGQRKRLHRLRSRAQTRATLEDVGRLFDFVPLRVPWREVEDRIVTTLARSAPPRKCIHGGQVQRACCAPCVTWTQSSLHDCFQFIDNTIVSTRWREAPSGARSGQSMDHLRTTLVHRSPSPRTSGLGPIRR